MIQKRFWKRFERILLQGYILYFLLGTGSVLCALSFVFVLLYGIASFLAFVFYVGLLTLVIGLFFAVLAFTISVIHDLKCQS